MKQIEAKEFRVYWVEGEDCEKEPMVEKYDNLGDAYSRYDEMHYSIVEEEKHYFDNLELSIVVSEDAEIVLYECHYPTKSDNIYNWRNIVHREVCLSGAKKLALECTLNTATELSVNFSVDELKQTLGYEMEIMQFSIYTTSVFQVPEVHIACGDITYACRRDEDAEYGMVLSKIRRLPNDKQT